MEVTRIRYTDLTQQNREIFSILYYQGCGGRKALVLPHGTPLVPGRVVAIGESRVSWSGEMNESAFTVIHPRELQIAVTKERWNCEDLASKCPQCSPESLGATGRRPNSAIVEADVWMWDALWLVLLVLFILGVVWLLWYMTR